MQYAIPIYNMLLFRFIVCISQFLTNPCYQSELLDSIPFTMERNALVEAESGNSSTKLSPKSQHLAIRGSNGTAPRNGTLNCFARAAAPPVVAANIFDSPYLSIKKVPLVPCN